MRKVLSSFALATLLWAGTTATAQSRVFKEVGEGIASSMRPIVQDKNMVGYLVFTRLEAASEDSFNYQLTIMDENLNDIGKVKFRDLGMELQAVAFEQDVLALSFIKSKLVGQEFRSGKRADTKAVENENSYLHNKFVNLEGKILGTQEEEVETKKDYLGSGKSIWRYQVSNRLKNSVQLQNIPGKGFALYYYDERSPHLIAFGTDGKVLWRNKANKLNDYHALLTTKDQVLLLGKDNPEKLGYFTLMRYDLATGEVSKTQKLNDKKGNPLQVVTFDADPITGQPYVSGYVTSKEKDRGFVTLNSYTDGRITGLFTMNITGNEAKDYKAVYHMWNAGEAMGQFNEKGKMEQQDMYPMISSGFKGYDGNTYFVGSGVHKKLKVGSIISTVLTLPLVIPPIFIAGQGYTRVRIDNAFVLKQGSDGKVSVHQMLAGNRHKYQYPKDAFFGNNQRELYQVNNPEAKNQFVIVDDKDDTFVYNITQQKLVRTIPHRDGNVRTNIFPAKQGYVMVSEYNRKLQETRYSIEAL